MTKFRVADDLRQSAYIGAAHEAEAAGRRASVQECQEAVKTVLREAMANDQLEAASALEEWIELAARETHENVTNHGKGLLRKFEDGQLLLIELMEDALLPIGEGAVSTVGGLDAASMLVADFEQYQNVEQVQQRYAAWRRHIYGPYFPVLQRTGKTLRKAYQDGDLS